MCFAITAQSTGSGQVRDGPLGVGTKDWEPQSLRPAAKGDAGSWALHPHSVLRLCCRHKALFIVKQVDAQSLCKGRVFGRPHTSTTGEHAVSPSSCQSHLPLSCASAFSTWHPWHWSGGGSLPTGMLSRDTLTLGSMDGSICGVCSHIFLEVTACHPVEERSSQTLLAHNIKPEHRRGGEHARLRDCADVPKK